MKEKPTSVDVEELVQMPKAGRKTQVRKRIRNDTVLWR